MLAHAIAHIAERRGFRPATHSGEIPAWFAAGGGHEIEADVLAVKMTSGAGYDPEALFRYIGRIQPTGTRESRIAGTENAIRELPPKVYSESSVDEFTRLQDVVRRAVPG